MRLEQVPLSDGTVSRRITDMAQDIKCQLIDRVKKSGRYSLQLDESTDVSSTAQLLVFVRYIFEGKLNEEMLFCTQLEGSCTGEDIFNKLDSKLKDAGLSWGECLSVCTDGARAMLGKKKGLKARVLQVAPHLNFTHCIIHREALACKTLNAEFKHVLDTAVKIVNYIKSRPLNTRLFSTLCNEMGSEHKGLLLHTEVRWLSSPLADHLSDADWVTRLAYLSCIFEKLNGLNVSLQGENTNILYLNDKVQAFARKLVRWRERVEMGRIDMFSELEEFMEENALSVNSIKASITAHLQSLLDHFHKYFPEGDAPDQYDWIRSPFNVTTANHLASDMEDALIELSTDRTLRTALDGKTLDEFWVSVALEYPQLSKAALDVLMQFGSTYLCEKTFSALTYIKNKHRSRLNVEDDLRVGISKIKPRVDLLCSAHSAHPSH
uniref:HAT C-terminal dimerisation domain-containing protein n=1 Tax=Cyprinus carpio TaxID=7962 RepID=A0A8C2E398_CYPCA